MKKMKKIMALLLAGAMTMAMSFATFADEAGATAVPVAAGTNTLTVNVNSTTPAQDLKGQTINLYKLFDVTESGTPGSKNYAYTVNTATDYKNAIKSALGTSFTGTTDEEYAAAVLVLKDTEGAVQKFANDFTAYALKNSLVATKTSGKITDSKTSHQFTELDAGYYLVYVTGGKEIQSSLVTVDETTNTVNLKTEAPSIEKTADKTTVNIGDVVTYTVKGSIPDTTGYDQYQYIIHDELSTGLDFVNDAAGTALDTDATTVNVTVAFTDSSLTVGGTAPTTATLDSTKHKKMSLDLSKWVRDNQENKGKQFTVIYYAKVNAQAVVTEKNNAQLEYGNKPGETTTTTPSEAKTPTYPLDILKKKKDADEKLAGAKFSLYMNETDAASGTNAIKVSGSNGNYVVDPTSSNTVFESVASIDEKNFNLHVNGLAEGVYYLKEIEAPAGYNKLTAPIKITIKKSTDADETKWTLYEGDSETPVTDKYIKVENSTGSLLPSTGGRGTIAFAVVAVLLVFGVTVSYIRDKKKEA